MELLDKWGYTTINFNDYRLFLAGELNLPRRPIIISFDDGYEEVKTIVYPILHEFRMKAVVFVLADFDLRTNKWDSGIGCEHPLLTKEQVVALHEAGFEMGSHTLSHPRLTQIPEDKTLYELRRSREILEEELKTPVHTFAYPYGLTNERIKRLAGEAGYTIACGAFTGPPLFGTDLMEVRRIKVMDTKNPLVFWFQLQSMYLHYRVVVRNVKIGLTKLFSAGSGERAL
jgi:peptidoglycan/xylan/chitin deacetylase (PgdA/CDA1 family)